MLVSFHFVQVVKYWPEKGQSGFIVWRYRLRRDDQVRDHFSLN